MSYIRRFRNIILKRHQVERNEYLKKALLGADVLSILQENKDLITKRTSKEFEMKAEKSQGKTLNRKVRVITSQCGRVLYSDWSEGAQFRFYGNCSFTFGCS